MPGFKHLIECHCTLKIYDKKNNLVNHKFPVYSKIKESGGVVPKIVKCNNCEAVHKVTDFCVSELMPGKDQTSVISDVEEISLSLPDKLVNTLRKLECDISCYEHCLDIIEEERWGEFVVLRRDIIDEKENLKLIFINSENRFKIQTKVINNIIIQESI